MQTPEICSAPLEDAGCQLGMEDLNTTEVCPNAPTS